MGDPIEAAKKGALEVLLSNMRGPYGHLPRTAGWGYPEPYTRDLMISGLGILVSGNERLIRSFRRVLETLAENQGRLGQIPSLVHDPKDLGASDATPLFLLMAGVFRRFTGEGDFLREAVDRALAWMDYQSPEDNVMVPQLPTTDWRDEQWVTGYGLYVNTLVYGYLRLFGQHKKADLLRRLMGRSVVMAEAKRRHLQKGLALRHKPYYALWSYKVHSSQRFDLLGNSLAIIMGIASKRRAGAMASWIEHECSSLRKHGALALDLPPALFPYIQPQEADWMPRYARFNRPGEYHNGGVWPFVCGFYIAALVAAGKHRLAGAKLDALTQLVRPARRAKVNFGFNEWFRAQDRTPCGQDWQSWSAAMYLYAAACVESRRTPFFDEVRHRSAGRT